MNLPRTLVALLVLGAVRLRGGELELPTPPQQRAPWVAPENAPTNLVSAVRTLFEQGFPDPRGCEYREVEVVVSDVWGRHKGPVATRGWVLPATSDSTQRFAICWNGVIYPVRSVGAPSDLEAEVSALPPNVARRLDFAVGEHGSVFFTDGLSTRTALLLRCGKTDAALKLWHQWGGVAKGYVPGEALSSSALDDFDPYLHLAEDWAWALFDRLITAQMRGDDALALATARLLAEAQPKIEAEAARRGFPSRRSSGPGGKGTLYLTFLEQLPQLLSDLERRVSEGPRTGALERGVTNLPTPAERVRALVRDLDQVCARQWGQPGYVDFFGDPIVALLVAEGDAAVEPLLACLESDRRLTRSVTFPRDFMRRRTVLPVAEVARTILKWLWQYEFRQVAEARAYWNRFKGVPLEERWYAILQDDAAGVGRWREAADNIVRTQHVRVVAGVGVTSVEATNGPPRFQGEALRGKTNPSVSALLARRALEIPVAGEGAAYDLANACDIALCLALWDGPAFVPVARKLVQRCQTVLEYSAASPAWPAQRLASYIGKFTLTRAAVGDASALEEYAAWLPKVAPAQLAEYLPEALGPLRLCATNDAMRALAERLFSPTNTPWSQLPRLTVGLFNPVESELVQLPAFRKLLARELGRRDVCGWIIRDGTASVRIQITNQLFGPTRFIGHPVDRPLTGTNAALRWCDWIAWSLLRTNQIPAFDPFAPVEERDQMIQQAGAILQR